MRFFLDFWEESLDFFDEFWVCAAIAVEMSMKNIGEAFVFVSLKLLPGFDKYAILEVFSRPEYVEPRNKPYENIDPIHMQIFESFLIWAENYVAGFSLFEEGLFAYSDEFPELVARFHLFHAVAEFDVSLGTVRVLDHSFQIFSPALVVTTCTKSEAKNPIQTIDL